jgi:TatD DNase family protein
MKLIDTHCHLDASAFDADRDDVVTQANLVGVQTIVVPSVTSKNFTTVIKLSEQYVHCVYALGIHPMAVDSENPSDITTLRELVEKTLYQKNKLVAIGEIGLDYFVTKDNWEIQEYFFREQLAIAKENNLPVILHVRRAIDEVLKHLRNYQVCGGIAHAFNGSMQQAETFIDLGFKLGFGGAMTYSRALKIRELAKNLPLESILLETDAPDMAPTWLGKKARNSPKELLQIAEIIADIRRIPLSQIIEITSKNSQLVLPNLASLCTSVEVLH